MIKYLPPGTYCEGGAGAGLLGIRGGVDVAGLYMKNKKKKIKNQ